MLSHEARGVRLLLARSIRATRIRVSTSTKKIPYNLLMVTDEIINQLRENGFQQLPVVRAPGMKSWSGFRPDRIDEYAKRAILPSDATWRPAIARAAEG